MYLYKRFVYICFPLNSTEAFKNDISTLISQLKKEFKDYVFKQVDLSEYINVPVRERLQRRMADVRQCGLLIGFVTKEDRSNLSDILIGARINTQEPILILAEEGVEEEIRFAVGQQIPRYSCKVYKDFSEVIDFIRLKIRRTDSD